MQSKPVQCLLVFHSTHQMQSHAVLAAKSQLQTFRFTKLKWLPVSKLTYTASSGQPQGYTDCASEHQGWLVAYIVAAQILLSFTCLGANDEGLTAVQMHWSTRLGPRAQGTCSPSGMI